MFDQRIFTYYQGFKALLHNQVKSLKLELLVRFHLCYFIIVSSYSWQWKRFLKAQNKIDHVINNFVLLDNISGHAFQI